jgi:hypothetical protein
MGCGSSKPPIFPDPSVANCLLPHNPPDQHFQCIKLIPGASMFAGDVAIFFPNDFDHPSFFIRPSGVSMKCLRYFNEGEVPEEMAEIKMGDCHQRSTTAEKTFIIAMKTVEGVNDEVSLTKFHDEHSTRRLGNFCKIEKGYEIQEDGENKREVLLANGNVIAYSYDSMFWLEGPEMVSASSNLVALMKSPVIAYVNRDLSETETIRALTMIVVANNHLLPAFMVASRKPVKKDRFD